MKPKIKKTILSLSLALLLASFAMQAQAFIYQTPWPKSPMGTEMDSDPTLAEGVKYVYEWGIGLGGIAVFIVLVMAGFQYITSVGDPGKMKEAFKRIEEAVVGLLILLSSYAILNLVGLNLTSLKINPFTPNFDNPVQTCTEAATQAAESCCKTRAYDEATENYVISDIPGCDKRYYKCVNGTCQPNIDKEECSKVELTYVETDASGKNYTKVIGNSYLDKTGVDAYIEIPSDRTISKMKLYSMQQVSGSGEYIPCYDPSDPDTSKPENPICNCGIQLFTKKLTAGAGGSSTNSCQNNTDTQFAADNTTLKSYTQSKTVICVTFSKIPSVY